MRPLLSRRTLVVLTGLPVLIAGAAPAPAADNGHVVVATAFDIAGVDLSHHGGDCACETILRCNGFNDSVGFSGPIFDGLCEYFHRAIGQGREPAWTRGRPSAGRLTRTVNPASTGSAPTSPSVVGHDCRLHRVRVEHRVANHLGKIGWTLRHGGRTAEAGQQEQIIHEQADALCLIGDAIEHAVERGGRVYAVDTKRDRRARW